MAETKYQSTHTGKEIDDAVDKVLTLASVTAITDNEINSITG